MAVKRKQNWEFALHEFFTGRAGDPFVYGTNDCAIFVADAVKAATGTDIACDFRGKYKTELGSLKALRQVCGGTTVEHAIEYASRQHALEELPSVYYAHRGDVVLFDNVDGKALGIVYLNGKDAVFTGPDGLRKIPVKQCKRAWRVNY